MSTLYSTIVSFPVLAFALIGLGPFCLAQSEPASPQAASDGKNQVADWIRQLDADAFADRQAASEKLQAAGRQAIDSLRQAALGESREASVRALEILKKPSCKPSERMNANCTLRSQRKEFPD